MGGQSGQSLRSNALKIAAFVGSVMALSWFFAGCRQGLQRSTPESAVNLAAAGLVLGLLVALQAYWIYFEEKSKGTLRARIMLFEAIHNALAGLSSARTARKNGEDDNAQQ